MEQDLDPVENKTFSRIRIRIQIRKKPFWIRTAPDRNEFEVNSYEKLIKKFQFFNKNNQFGEFNFVTKHRT